jgi:hypothetical protein
MLLLLLLLVGRDVWPLNLMIGLLPQMPSSQQMAYPAYLENNIAVVLGYILPQFMVLSFCFIVPPILKRIVHEKETGIKVRSAGASSTTLLCN